MNNTPQRGANEGNAADRALMADQGYVPALTKIVLWIIMR